MPRTADPITKSRIDRALPKKNAYELTDGACHGLELRIRPSGTKTWQYRYVAPTTGERRRIVLGHFPKLSIKGARAKAAEHHEQIAAGADPAVGIAAQRRTVGELLDHYEQHHLPKQRDPGTTLAYINKHLRPWSEERWGQFEEAASDEDLKAAKRLDRRRKRVLALKVSDAQPEDFTAIINAASRGARRKLLGILKIAFSYGERLGWRAPGTNPITLQTRKNPAGFFRLPREEKHDRVLTQDEVRRVMDELDAALRRKPKTRGHLAPHYVLALQLIAETGARASEILNARWDDIDANGQVLRVEEHKTAHLGFAGPKTIMLSDRAMDFLAEGPNPAGFICACETGKPLTVDNLSRAWNKLADRLGLNKPGMTRRERATLHTLRHTMVHHALEAGIPEDLVQQNAGHASIETTRAWYKNASALERRRAAANAASAAIRPAAMETQPRCTPAPTGATRPAATAVAGRIVEAAE